MVAIPKTRWWAKGTAAVQLDVVSLGFVSIVSALSVAWFLFQEQKLVGTFGMPLDDAWIHFRIAENIAAGYGFSFNPGEPTSASTSPVWTLLLAFAYMLTGQCLLPALALGFFFFLSTNIAVYAISLALKPDRRLAIFAATVSAITGRWLWAGLSGMETPMFTALSVWGLLLHASGRRGYRIAPHVGACLLALSGLVRPEGYLLLCLAIVDRAVQSFGFWPPNPRDRVRIMVACIPSIPSLLLMLSLGARIAYTLSMGGGLAGNTFLAQSLPQGDSPYTGPRLIPDIYYIRSAIRSLSSDNFLLGLFIPLGMLAWIRMWLLERQTRSLTAVGLIWFVGLPLASSVIAPNLRHHERYLMPLIPFAVLLAAFGVDFATSQIVISLPISKLRLWGRAVGSVALFFGISTLCLGDALFEAKRWSMQYAGDVRSIQAINVELGEWLRRNTPRDAYVAMNDIGAIAFFSGRRVLDTVGIAEPRILPYIVQRGRAGVIEYLFQKRPEYLVIWPEWYPEVAGMKDIFEPVYAARMEDPITSTRASMLGGREMVVYKAHWPE